MFPTSRREAIASGAKRFLSSKPCLRGHMSERFTTSSLCVECSRLLCAEYQKVKAVEIAAQRKEKYEATKQEVLAQRKEYYAENRDTVIDRVARYRDENREKVRAGHRAHYANDPIKRRAMSHTQRAKRAKAPGSHTKEDVLDILQAQKSKCACCRCSIKQRYHIDHIVPLARGGSNDRRNLQLLCAGCNQRKSAKDPIDHMQSLGFLI